MTASPADDMPLKERFPLEPCAHCAGVARFKKHAGDPADWWTIECTVDDCGARTMGFGLPVWAAKAWNRRAPADAGTSLQKAQTTTGGAPEEAALQRADAVITEFTGVTLTRDDVWRLKRRVRTAITGRMG